MRLPVVALLTLLAAPSLWAATGEASGEFTAGTRAPIHPTFAAAFETRDQRDPHKRVIEVILSEAPVDITAAVNELDPHAQIINQPAVMKHNYVLLWVRPDGDVSMNATYSETMTQFADMTGSMGDLKADFTTNTPDTIVGHVQTAKPVKTLSESYSANFRFSTTVTRTPPGSKLPADGGQAGEAFQSLVTAIANKSWEGIQQNLTTENVKHLTDADRSAEDNLASAIETLGFWLPKAPVKVTGGELVGDKAVLEVEGVLFGKQKALYLVQMVKRDTHWLFDRATKAGMID